MTVQILICCLLLVITTVVHSTAMVFALKTHHVLFVRGPFRRLHFRRSVPIAVLVIVMFLASVIECFAWALTYMKLGAIDGLERALYFSTVTYTTLGYGDVTLHEQWRLLSAFEAVNGVLMFGWSTAIIVAAVQRVNFPSLSREGSLPASSDPSTGSDSNEGTARHV